MAIVSSITLARGWSKLMNEDNEDTEFIEDIVLEIVSQLTSIKGGEMCDQSDITDWLNCDTNDVGYHILSN